MRCMPSLLSIPLADKGVSFQRLIGPWNYQTSVCTLALSASQSVHGSFEASVLLLLGMPAASFLLCVDGGPTSQRSVSTTHERIS
jgi:hypothetical protein